MEIILSFYLLISSIVFCLSYRRYGVYTDVDFYKSDNFIKIVSYTLLWMILIPIKLLTKIIK